MKVEKLFEEITRLEREKDELNSQMNAKGLAKFEVLGWCDFQRKRRALQDKLDALYRTMEWD